MNKIGRKVWHLGCLHLWPTNVNNRITHDPSARLPSAVCAAARKETLVFVLLN